MDSRTYFPTLSARWSFSPTATFSKKTLIVPFPFMASVALMTILRMTCLICDASNSTGKRSSGLEISQLIPDPLKEALTVLTIKSPIEATFLIGLPPLENVINRAAKSFARMDAFWGDRTWRDVAYTKTQGLFGDIEEKTSTDVVTKAFRERLKKVAGFAYVPEPIPMRNSNGVVVYYLFFASPNKIGAKIVKNIYDKYRNRGIS